MRPSRRIPLSHCAIVVLLVAAFSSATLAQNSGPANRPAQPEQAAPATQAQLPAKWNEAVRALAEKIAGATGSPRKISVEVKNISSLDSSATSRIRQAIESDLAGEGVKLNAGGLRVRVTISEGTEGYIWVAECDAADGRQLAIVSAPKEAISTADHLKESLSLDKKLVWEQPGKFVDFALFTRPVGSYSTLVVLEPDRLAYYRSADSPWQFWKSIPIPHTTTWPRDLRGRIGASNEIETPWLPGVQCYGDLEDPDKVQCGPLKQHLLITRIRLNVPGHQQAELAGLWNRCGADSVVLASGSGDWTQPDTIQGYLLPEFQAQAIPSGSALGMDGPVMDLHPEGRELAARAVVRNLKTGKYEAYIVTATCSQ
jgi:hypothetical protein